MSKKCLKCGCIISDDVVTGYCHNCSRVVPPKTEQRIIEEKDKVYDNLIGEEKMLSVTTIILIVASILSSMIILFSNKLNLFCSTVDWVGHLLN